MDRAAGGVRLRCLPARSGGYVSWSLAAAHAKFTRPRPNAAKAQTLNGLMPKAAPPGQKSSRFQCAVIAPIAGPMIKPRPMHAPSIPMPLARWRPSQVSATTADAVEILPAMMPPTVRAARSTRNDPETNQSRCDSAVPAKCDEQRRTAANAIGEAAPDRRKEELQERIDRTENAAEERHNGKLAAADADQHRDQPADHTVGPLQVDIVREHLRKQRKNDRKADHVDQHSQ